MKTIILTICLISVAAMSLNSCQDYTDLFPESCHKVLNIKDAGEKEVILFNTGEDSDFNLTIMKTGSTPDASVDAKLEPMSEQDYAAYAERYNLEDTYIPGNLYTLFDNDIHFDGQDRYKFVKVSFKTSDISEQVKKGNGIKYALPLLLKSNNATVNDSIIIIKPQIIIPSVGFETGGYKLFHTIESTSSQETSFTVQAKIPMDNMWDFDCQVQVTDKSKELFNQMNNNSGNQYRLMPEHNYQFNEKVSFKKSQNTADLKIDINKQGLSRGFFVIPIEITSCSKAGFEIDQNKKVIFVGVNYIPERINFTTAQLSSNSVMAGDGTGLAGLSDGIGAGLHFHSKWSGVVVDPVYGNYIDFKLNSPIQTVMFEYLTRFENGNAAPTKIKLFTSNDGQQWSELGYIDRGLPRGGNMKFTSSIYSAESSFRYFRFAVLESVSGSMTSGGSWFNLGEFLLYGN